MMRDFLFGLAITLLALVLYAATLQPDLGGPEDTPKFQFLGYVLGTGHPPGYPLYVILSHVFVKLPIGTIAYRANLFSAVLASLACGIAYVIGRSLGASRWAAACAAGGLATGASFWQGAVFAEVYSLAAVMAASTVVLLLAWDARGTAPWLLAAVAAFALGLGNHLTILGLVPAAVLFVLIRNRRGLTTRVILGATCLLLLGASQYGLIVLRTRQGAPYLESRATSLPELMQVVTAARFSEQRFAFGPSELLTLQIPTAAAVIARDLRPVGLILLGVGLVDAARRRRLNTALVAGAAAGMFVMVINLSGDTGGFIIPVVTLLWPLAGTGIETLARAVQSFSVTRLDPRTLVLALATAIPLAGAAANYTTADQSGNSGMARFLRTAYAQLPDRSAIVAEDYFIDMALRYLMATGEAGPNREIALAGFGAGAVREAVQDGRRVFAFGGAATFFGAEGLRFERVAMAGPPLSDWLSSLPRGTIVVGASAGQPVPSELTAISSRRPAVGRPRAMTVFAFVAGQPETIWREEDGGLALLVEPHRLAPNLQFAGPVVLTADERGARIDLDRRTLARTAGGLALAAFSRTGTWLQAFEVPAGAALQAPLDGAVFELKAEAPCVELTTDTWTDVAPVLSTGSWLATMAAFGSVVVETEVFEPRGARASSSDLVLANTAPTTGPAVGVDVDVWRTELSRARSRRPVFRMAFDRPVARARARLSSGGALSTMKLCSHVPAVVAERGLSRINPDLASEAYFGTGWSAAERSTTGYVRRAAGRASLLVPLSADHAYRLSLDMLADPVTALTVHLNGDPIGECQTGGEDGCVVTVPRGRARDGVNAVTLVTSGPFTFHGAYVVRRE